MARIVGWSPGRSLYDRCGLAELVTNQVFVRIAGSAGFTSSTPSTSATSSAIAPAAATSSIIAKDLQKIEVEVLAETKSAIPEAFVPQMEYLLRIGVLPSDLKRLAIREILYPQHKKILHRKDINVKVEFMVKEFELEGWQIGKVSEASLMGDPTPDMLTCFVPDALQVLKHTLLSM